jgi:ABC-type nickel/cobalt efflux system permease component RcnA
MNKNLILISVAAFLLLAAINAYAVPGATNPFLTPPSQEQGKISPSVETPTDSAEAVTPAPSNHNHSGLYGKLLTEISLWQKMLRGKMAMFGHKIHSNPFGKSFFLFLAFSFFYGVIHAIGPGHGKSVVCAYFMTREGKLFSTAFLSWMITLVHVGSATLAICGAYLLLKTGMSGFERFSSYMQNISFSIIILIGLWLFISSISGIIKKLKPEQESPSPQKYASISEMAMVAFFTGIIPCPGAAIILVYTISTGIMWAGLISMVVLATGMAITTFLFAFTAFTTRKAINCGSSDSGIKRFIPSALSLIGSLVVIAFGILMLEA